MNHFQLSQRDPDNINLLDDNDIYNCKYISVDSFQGIKQTFSDTGLSLLCFNIRSFSKNSEEFLGYISNCKHSFDVIVLTETWAKDETQYSFQIPGYNSLHNFRKNKRGGGVSIFIKDTYKYTSIDELDISEEAFESIGATIYYPESEKSFNVIGVYRPPDKSVNDATEKLRYLINDKLLHRQETIITGDFNICLLKEEHSEQTKDFMNMMKEYFFRPLITRPTRFSDNGATVIDHIWTNSPVTANSYIFYCDITDHCPVYCRLNIQFETENKLKKVKFRDMSLANKQKFHDMLNNTDWDRELRGILNTNDQVSKLLGIISDYYNQCFPIKIKTIGLNRLTKPWITDTLLKSINRKHNLYKLVQQNLYDKELYKRYANILTSLIRTSKVLYYKQQFELYKNDIKKTWAIINNTIKPGKKITSILKLYHNNETITEPAKIAETLNNHFAGIGLALRNALPHRANNCFRKYLPATTTNSIYIQPCTSSEVKSVILGLKNVKGNCNSLSTKLLKENSLALSGPIAQIFNNIIQSGQYPDILKLACITAIFKGGDKTNPNNYRPISSLPILNKLFEKLLHKRLNSYFENNIFCKEQYGFRKKKSTSDAVNELLSKAYSAINKKEHLGAVFLDLSKAFDTVSHDILLLKLEHYGIRGTPLKLLESYLSNRHQFVTVNGYKSKTKEINIGVPQGSVLGPLLFLIYINDLPLSTRNMKSILFADDTTLFASHRDAITLTKIMSDDLALVREWLIANRLTLNINKTYYTIFTTGTRFLPNDLRVTIGEHAIERRLSGKFLGMTLDDKLTFKEHINTVKGKVSKLVGLLFQLKKVFPLEVLNKLYYSLIYPHLNYCILAWGSAKPTFLYPLITLQKRIARILTDSSYYAHSDPLFNQLKMMKIKDLYLFHCQIFMYKIINLDKYPNFREEINAIQPAHSYNMRYSNLITPYCRSDVCKQSLLYQGIRAWNQLTNDVKTSSSLNSFKSKCKMKLVSKY